MHMKYIILIILMAITTYITRASCLVFFNNKKIPKLIQRFLKYIPVSILASLIFPSIVAPHGSIYLNITNPYIVASVITIASILLIKKGAISIVLGIISLILLKRLI